jgi:NADH-quinone oxidoreductase subunit G
MPKITINGKEVEVKEGTSIIDAMFQSGDRIAHYCYHPGLSVAGVCRLCMIEIEGNPRLQIACNTTVAEGMKINNTSPKVKDAVKWGLDFHLINHPLDCPICDQAGECGLQDQYMEYGKYDPEMAEHKVKKHKVVDLGPTVVLDSERCILCSRCVRFTKEVSKTEELGIFNRGDRSEIGTVEGKELNNPYSMNTVDICPVGALTSKDFRFRQRVWYLKDGNTVCNGCSTGCNIKVYFNKEGLFRVKPVYNEKVNGHWMCDSGREIYKFANRDFRFIKGLKRTTTGWDQMHPGAVAKDASQVVADTLSKTGATSVGLVLTGQYTVEEYDTMIGTFVTEFKSKNIFHWLNNPESAEAFDGLLIRGDKNPNTLGLKKVLEKYGVTSTWADLSKAIDSGSIKTLVVAGPENISVYPDANDKINLFKKVANLIWLGSAKVPALDAATGSTWIIPMKTFVEKEGTFINYAGLEQKFNKVTNVVSEALTLIEAAVLLSGKNLVLKQDSLPMVESMRAADKVTIENRKKNEFIFKRGQL